MEVQGKEFAMSTATLFDLDTLPPVLYMSDSSRVRLADPLTSHAAADSNDVPRSHRLVLDLFESHRWLAQFEAEQLLAGLLSPSRVRTAFTELELAGELLRTDLTMPTPYGRTAQLWEVNR
jgi:hypothetical protein